MRILRLGVVVAVVALAGVAAMASPPEASAFHEPSPFQSLRSQGTSSPFFEKFKSLLRGSGPTSTSYGTLLGGETAPTKKGLASMLYRARVGSRFLPTLGVAALRLSLIGSAGYIGWRVYQHYNGTDTTYDLWIDSNTLGKDSLYNLLAVFGAQQSALRYGMVEWRKHVGTDCTTTIGHNECFYLAISAGALDAFSSYKTSERLKFSSPMTPDSQGVNKVPDYDDCVAAYPGSAYQSNCTGGGNVLISGGTAWTTNPTWHAQTNYAVTRTQENLAGRVFNGYTIGLFNFPALYGTVGGVQIDGQAVVVDARALGPTAGLAGTDTLPGAPDLETEYNVPSDAGETPGDVTDALDEFDTPCGRALINHVTHSLYYPWVPGCIELAPEEEPEHAAGATAPKTLPKPMPGETATAYRTRLRTVGLLGTIIIDELTDAELPTEYQWQPSEVVQIHIGNPATTIPIVSPWPIPGPIAAHDSPITIESAPETPLDPRLEEDPLPPGYGGGGDFGTCDPWLEADLDLSPLTGLSFGDKFPFALFSWVGGVLGSFSTVADAPNWTFEIVIPATAVSGETDLGDFTVDLEWADSYMATVRTILTFVLWVGAVWFFATSLLGLRAPGNPAEAVDEA